ncbi:hypothetical protein PO124_01865 [Bacillus licheniformis]|nr:hypothetical protein [Bacillus licheniformis]
MSWKKRKSDINKAEVIVLKSTISELKRNCMNSRSEQRALHI